MFCTVDHPSPFSDSDDCCWSNLFACMKCHNNNNKMSEITSLILIQLISPVLLTTGSVHIIYCLFIYMCLKIVY